MFNDLTFRLITHDRERAEFEVALAHQWINKQEVEAAATLRIADINGFFSMHVYEVRPRIDKRGIDLLSDALPFGAL